MKVLCYLVQDIVVVVLEAEVEGVRDFSCLYNKINVGMAMREDALRMQLKCSYIPC